MFKNLRAYENLHITLWLIKDTCWVLLWKPLGIIILVPTVFVAFHIAWRSRKMLDDFFHNIAVCLWICANGIWMIGEFFYEDQLRHYAMIFFILGLIVVGFYYIVHFPKRKERKQAQTPEQLI